ncbi:MAG TPA: AmmeMemoRadiSam system radical SAM enzyme [Clostridiales bacterium]|nr:AmmeMemoRadiSam system radical SAM enzyme [Clostridiales bacterium]
MKIICEICPHHCKLSEGQIGICKGRINLNGLMVEKNYGKVTAIALDPIEKKPLYHFYPGTNILSVGSYGCNLKCPFCQNHEISMDNGEKFYGQDLSPKQLVDEAVQLKGQNNIGIAYTYNEPLIAYEFVKDCSTLAKEKGLKNVVVTNGYICKDPLVELLPNIDALNIDLKGFTNEFYKNINGDLETVKNTIQIANNHCHIEVTTLIIPGENDSVEEMEKLSSWLASVNPEIPFHISRFFPNWEMNDANATPVKTIYNLVEVAKKNLKYVYKGNC